MQGLHRGGPGSRSAAERQVRRDLQDLPGGGDSRDLDLTTGAVSDRNGEPGAPGVCPAVHAAVDPRRRQCRFNRHPCRSGGPGSPGRPSADSGAAAKRVMGSAVRRTPIGYSSKKTPLRSRPMTDLTLVVVLAGSDVNRKPGALADHSIWTAQSRNLPVKRCTASVTFIGFAIARQRISKDTLAGSLGPSTNALCRLW